MRVPYSWLQDYVSAELPPPTELADILTLAGLEVDSIERAGAGIEKVVVAQIEEIKLHPEAEHLLVAKVNISSQDHIQVVTGAKNLRPGLKVPLALPGASLADGQTVAAARFRGLMSEGMLCSAEEIGWEEPSGKETAGILILPESAKLGENVAEVLSLGDLVLTLEVTPDRPDCLSLIGIAREVATATGAKVLLPASVVPNDKTDADGPLSISIADQDLCLRYAGALIRKVSIGSSPVWLKQRLTAAGMRPVNTVVDITNYVMLEIGQPLHAFDYGKLSRKQIVVRRSRPGEILTTLDGSEQELSENMLVIADGDRPQGLAGIMGGMASEVTTATNTVLLESACFANTNIRRTAHHLGMRTEASLRFERGVDPNGAIFALQRSALLLEQLGAGELDFIVDIYPQPVTPRIISVNTDRIRRLIGTTVDDVFIKAALERLQLQVVREDYPALQVRVPTFRPDLEQEADLVEEVARLYGFDRIPALPLEGRLQIGQRPLELRIELMIKDILRGCGLDEVQTYSLVDPDSIAKLKLPPTNKRQRLMPLLFPLSSEQSVLRTMLIPSLLEVAALNQRRKAQAVNIFEVSRVYLSHQLPPTELPSMPRHLGIVLAGAVGERSWQGIPAANSFYRLKGILEKIAEKLGVAGKFVSTSLDFYHPGRQTCFEVDGSCLGVLGELHPDAADSFGLSGRVYALELDLTALLSHIRLTTRYRALPRYPGVERDLALIVPEDTEAAQVTQVIMESAGPYLAHLRLFDVYLGAPVPAGYKNLAYSLLFRSADQTLTEEDVNPHLENIIMQAAEKTGAILRH
ncbi:MAG TPA: phenylalanine--tRNA ligase subunit beta [Firmicutes bacterium]|nr:phenylalanine--tRNA ligase subunit beta [Bacillota bacterium]